MGWAYTTLFTRNRTRLIAIATALLLCIFYFSTPSSLARTGQHQDTFHSQDAVVNVDLQLPKVYDGASSNPNGDGFCADRYGIDYIHKFSQSATNYCDATSSSHLTCFTHKAHNDRTDSFCVGAPADVNAERKEIDLGCSLRELRREDGSREAPALSSFQRYWYNTGPAVVFDGYVKFVQEHAASAPASTGTQERILFLVQREETIDNLWHTLMQVMSLTLSLDVLRVTKANGTTHSLFTSQEIAESQVVILDHWIDGPFWDLWQMTSGMPTVRWNDISANLSDTKIVVPLAGGSNPFWQGDWVDLPCESSALLTAFSRRMMEFYGIPEKQGHGDELTLTFIDRKNQRHFVNQDAYFATLQAKYPQVKMQLVDFAAIPFAEQIRLAHSTDILAGVHGAGLTHGMFFAPGSTLVEILPPELDHRGFKNMVKFLGHGYFNRHGQHHANETGDWHVDDVYIDESSFMELMEEAITHAVKQRHVG